MFLTNYGMIRVLNVASVKAYWVRSVSLGTQNSTAKKTSTSKEIFTSEAYILALKFDTVDKY